MATLDFLITPTYNVNTLAVADTSTYDEDPADPDSPTLEISVPGFYSVVIPFVPEEVNVINSTILGLTETGQSALPDGVYVIRYSISPSYANFVEKSIMRVDKLMEEFDEAFLTLDIADCSGPIKKQDKIALDTIFYFIQGAVSAANNCATEEAVKLYNKASKLLRDFNRRGGECCGTNTLTKFY